MQFLSFLVFCRVSVLPKYIKNYFVKIIKEIINYREKENVSRKDFMQLMLQIRNTGKTSSDGDWKVETVAGI